MSEIQAFLIIEYALLIVLSPLIVFLYRKSIVEGWKANTDGFWLSLGIVLAWSGETLIRTWWLIWRSLDEPPGMVSSPMIVIFVACKLAGAICHAYAPLRKSSVTVRQNVAVGVLVCWLAMLVFSFYLSFG